MSRTPRLTREAIVDAAVAVADQGGVPQVSMRNVGRRLGVEAMSLYHHVHGKDELLDALADWFYTRIDVPDPRRPWRTSMRERALSARAVLADHPWGVGLIESRGNPGPALLRHHEAVLACLRQNGFSVPLAAHAFSVLDAYVYGFVVSEAGLPVGADGMEPVLDHMEDVLPEGEYPHLRELMAFHMRGRDHRYGEEFEPGLELILDGLEQRLGHGSA